MSPEQTTYLFGAALHRPSEQAVAHGELMREWRATADAAHDAYAEWRRTREGTAYAAYRAAADQADAAQDALAAAA